MGQLNWKFDNRDVINASDFENEEQAIEEVREFVNGLENDNFYYIAEFCYRTTREDGSIDITVKRYDK